MSARPWMLVGALLMWPARGLTQESPAAAEAAWSVVADAIPVKHLLDDEAEPAQIAVVVLPLPGDASGKVANELQRALVKVIKRHHLRHSATVVTDAALTDQPDEAIARTAAHTADVDLVLVVRGFPGAQPGEPPHLLFALLDGRGAVLRTQSSTMVVVPAQKQVAKGVERVLREDPAEDNDDDEKRPAGAGLREFKRRALTLERQRTRQGARYVIKRNGEEVDEEELAGMGGPPPDQARLVSAGGGMWRPVARITGPALCVLGICVAPLPLLACLAGFPALTGGISAVQISGAQNDVCVTCCGGIYYAGFFSLLYAPIPLGLGLLGSLLAGGLLGGGGAGLLTALYVGSRGGSTHPYVAFVRQHNEKLAKELKVKKGRLGKRYFPE